MHPGDDPHPATPDGVCQPGNAPPASAAPPRPAAARRRPAATAEGGAISADPREAIAGLETTVSRTGEDTRRRGWYWHWNHIVTQYAPLIGLEGVGLLNSYTVWTDRREESPLRGYAFPSQLSEASFYGQDRAELITINKILVTLDLIEIRKEMVVRADEQGRRWRVPHNLYRVKDHGDGTNLTTGDVLRVVELADRDRSVYRRVRHIFSARFAPIDGDNVWWRILDELGVHPTWQRLAQQMAAEESRASARTKAGHAARKGAFFVPDDRDTATPAAAPNDSDTDDAGEEMATSVATINRGLAPDVAPTNSGSGTSVDASNGASALNRPTLVAGLDTAAPTSVAPLNTTKNQRRTTTTTTTSGRASDEKPADDAGVSERGAVPENERAADSGGGAAAGGPGDRPAPGDGPGEAAGVRAFEEANGRPSTPAERTLIRGIAEQIDSVARASGAFGGTGWGWVAAATYEAVEAGSAFVAPRRLREIIARWSREGAPGDRRAMVAAQTRPATGAAAAAPRVEAGRVAGDAPAPVVTAPGAQATPAPMVAESAKAAPPPLPSEGGGEIAGFFVGECGMPSGQVWAAAVADLAAGGQLATDEVASWLRPSRLLARRGDGGLIVGAPNPLAQRRLATRYGQALASALARVVGGPVAVEVVVTSAWLATQAAAGDREVAQDAS